MGIGSRVRPDAIARVTPRFCAFADFGHVADQMAAGRAWRDITMGCDRRYRAAIAACVMEVP
jgi:hypothetical protein